MSGSLLWFSLIRVSIECITTIHLITINSHRLVLSRGCFISRPRTMTVCRLCSHALTECSQMWLELSSDHEHRPFPARTRHFLKTLTPGRSAVVNSGARTPRIPTLPPAPFPAGPQMWMEIQKGEGPNAPELQGSVFLGQVLTLVFTLADEHFDFDTNVLTCWALDGGCRNLVASTSYHDTQRKWWLRDGADLGIGCTASFGLCGRV